MKTAFPTCFLLLFLCSQTWLSGQELSKPVAAVQADSSAPAMAKFEAAVEGAVLSAPKLDPDFLDKCSNPLQLSCGGSVSGNTSGLANQFVTSDYSCFVGFPSNSFDGPDRLVQVTVTQKSSVRFVLDMQNGEDLDIVLLTGCNTNQNCSGFSILGNTLSTFLVYREVLDVNLNPGTYYLVIDSYNSTQAGTFTLSMDCQCDCNEPTGDQPSGSKLFADDFQNYLSNKNLSPQSTRWRLWDEYASNTFNVTPNSSVSYEATVKDDGLGNQFLNIRQNGAVQPDLVYLLDAKTTGRYRLSWQMQVQNGKSGYFNVLHTKPNDNGDNAVFAYETFFNANGSGTVSRGGTTLATFTYPIAAWFSVVNVIDLDANVAELWINGRFVESWPYRTGTAPKRIDAMNFYANTGNDYNVDNLCFWESLQNCSTTTDNNPICVENGQQLQNVSVARCQLYTAAEWEYCQSVCDYGGTMIYRGDNYSGSLDVSDQAPGLLRYVDCVDVQYEVVLNTEVPSNLFADIYLFYNDNGDQVGINWNDNGNSSLQCFVLLCEDPAIGCAPGQACIQSCPSGQATFVTLADNPCNSFYYIAIVGEVGDTYSNLSIIPTGNCPPNPPVIACNSTPVSSTLGASNSNSVFQNSAGSDAYESCYNGPRAYNGGEKFYKFTLTQPSNVTLRLTSSSLTGAFLFPYVCGGNCMDFAETSPTNTVGTMDNLLNEGTYYVVVDKAASGGSANFTLEIDCTPASPNPNTYFVLDDTELCPTNVAQKHQVTISSTARSFASDDQVEFRYPDSDGFLSSTQELTYTWGNTATSQQTYNIGADLSGDGLKCSYSPLTNDTFAIWIWQTENGKRTFRECEVVYQDASTTSGATATDQFVSGGISKVTQLLEKPAASFATSTSSIKMTDLAGSYDVQVMTNFEWATVENASWLSLTPTTYDGVKNVTLTVQSNPDQFPRVAFIKFYAVDDPNKYRQFVRVEQRGKCLPANVTVTASNSTLCAGESLTLTANPGTNLTNLYRYKWSTSATDTMPSFTFTPNTPGTFNYTVTITDKYCDQTATATKSVTVTARPPAPTNPQNKVICEGQTPVLSVTPGTGNSVNWYTQSVGGAIVQNTTGNFTPNPVPPGGSTVTYYAEAKSGASGNCLSATRTPVTLTVNALPTVTITQVECEPGQQTYFVVFNTTGNTVTTSAGAPTQNGNVYTKTGIPIANPLVITATASGTNCPRVQSIDPPICTCPPLSAPQALGNTSVSVCADEPLPTLTVTGIGADEQAVWYNAATNAQVATGPTYTPPGTGTYLAKRRSLVNPCESDVSTAFYVTVNPVPALALSTTECAPNLLTYSVVVATDATAVTASVGTVSNGSTAGTKLVSGIPTGTTVAITAQNSGTTCDVLLSVPSPGCPCPQVSQPSPGQSVTVCSGQTWGPLTVTVSADQTADWYNQPSGGQLQTGGQGTTSFTPLQAGTYYAETRSTVNGCKSSTRVPVTLTVNALPTLTLGNIECDDTYQNYLTPVTTNAASLTISAGVLTPNGPGNFIVQVPSSVDNVVLTATTTNVVTCSVQQVVESPNCECPTLSEPVGAATFTYCLGQTILPLSVTVGPNETVDWYSAATGGNLLATDTAQYLQTSAGTVYAQTRDRVSGCISGTRKAVTLVVNAPAAVTVQDLSPICANGNVLLNATLSGASGGTWTDGGAGGTFSNANQVSGVTYTPPTGVFNVILTLTSADPAGPCPAAADNTVLTINSLPLITTFTPQCNPVTLQTYSVAFTVSANTVVTYNLPGLSQTFVGGVYTVDGVPKGSNLIITATNTAGCSDQITVASPLCPCQPVLAPTSQDVENTVCAGVTPLPSFSVNLPTPNTVANWYQTPTGGTSIFTGPTFTPPTGGVYFVEAYNPFNTCSSLGTGSPRLQMTLNVLPLPVADAGVYAVVCRGQSVNVVGSGAGTGGTYVWSTGQNTQMFTFTPTNTLVLTVTATNAAGCADSDTATITVNQPPVATIAQAAPVLCFGGGTGALSITPVGYPVVWSNGLSNVAQINSLSAGNYSATVTDAAGCRDTAYFVLPQPALLTLGDTTVVDATDYQNNGSITAVIVGGTSPYQYNWLNQVGIPIGQTGATATGLEQGLYQVSVTDANGCSYPSQFFLVDNIVPTDAAYWDQRIELFPNPAGDRAFLRLRLPHATPLRIELIDATGRLIDQQRLDAAQNDVIELDLSTYAAGLYLVRLDLDGQTVARKLKID